MVGNTSPTPQPGIEVSANAGTLDGVQAALRLVGFLITSFIAIFGFLSVRDMAGLIVYIQANGGQIFSAISALIAFGIAAYGVYKTHKRGAQVAAVAANPDVPEDVAKLK